MEGAKWKSTVLEISMNWWQLEFHPTEFQFYQINSGYGVIRTLELSVNTDQMNVSYHSGYLLVELRFPPSLPPPPPLVRQCESQGPPIGVGREKNLDPQYGNSWAKGINETGGVLDRHNLRGVSTTLRLGADCWSPFSAVHYGITSLLCTIKIGKYQP